MGYPAGFVGIRSAKDQAKARGLILITHNTSDFTCIGGLEIED